MTQGTLREVRFAVPSFVNHCILFRHPKLFCHSRENGNPEGDMDPRLPAQAGLRGDDKGGGGAGRNDGKKDYRHFENGYPSQKSIL